MMNPQFCVQLLLLVSVLGALPESLTTLRLSYCTIIEIPHYFSELLEVLKLTCSDTFINNVLYMAFFLLLESFSLILKLFLLS